MNLNRGINHPEPHWLGHYEILTTIGRGGMGRVYLARGHRAHGVRRLVAVKTLLSELRSDPSAWDMLVDEARIGARIQHPNCVAVHELAEHEGLPFLVMDYVNGPSLSALARAMRVVPPRILTAVMLDALAGLHAAHETVDDFGDPIGLVHRDVSPGNILIDVSGNASVTDFGISKAQERISSTQIGVYKGKLRYLSPEQLSDPTKVDRRSDVFSAGIVLWELLTRKVLFRDPKSASATMHNVMTREVPPPSTVNPAIPPALDAVVMRSLERDPEARFQSAAEMAAALESAAETMDGIANRSETRAVVQKVWDEELRRRADVCRDAAVSGAFKLNTTEGGFTPRSNPVVKPTVAKPTVANPMVAKPKAPAGKRRPSRLLIVGLVMLLAGLVGAAAAAWIPLMGSSGSAPTPASPPLTAPPLGASQTEAPLPPSPTAPSMAIPSDIATVEVHADGPADGPAEADADERSTAEANPASAPRLAAEPEASRPAPRDRPRRGRNRTPTPTSERPAESASGPDLRDPDFHNPDFRNPDFRNPSVRNPSVRNPSVRSPDLRSPDLRSVEANPYTRSD
ncbi:MAG: protein kinase [Myxococcota bacterium]